MTETLRDSRETFDSWDCIAESCEKASGFLFLFEGGVGGCNTILQYVSDNYSAAITEFL